MCLHALSPSSSATRQAADAATRASVTVASEVKMRAVDGMAARACRRDLPPCVRALSYSPPHNVMSQALHEKRAPCGAIRAPPPAVHPLLVRGALRAASAVARPCGVAVQRGRLPPCNAGLDLVHVGSIAGSSLAAPRRHRFERSRWAGSSCRLPRAAARAIVAILATTRSGRRHPAPPRRCGRPTRRCCHRRVPLRRSALVSLPRYRGTATPACAILWLPPPSLRLFSRLSPSHL